MLALARVFFLAGVLAPLSAPLADQAVVRLASDEWCPYVCKSDREVQGGFLVTVATRALSATGLRVDARLLPLNRAMRETSDGTLDGVFAPPSHALLRPSVVLGYSRACFFTSTASTWTYRGIGSLKGSRLGLIGQYEYDIGEADQYIRDNASNRNAIDFSYGATAGHTNAKKLLLGRFDLLLAHELVMTKLIAELKAERKFINAGCLKQAFPLVIGFATATKRSELLLTGLAQGVRKLEKSGELDRIRECYGLKNNQDSLRKPHK